MKQQANKSFFGLKWLAVLIATLLLVGTFARVSTVNAETPQPVDTTKMKIQGAFEQKINFVDGEDYNATVTIKLTYNNPQYKEIKVPVQIKNLPTGKGGIRLYVYQDTDNSLIVQSFVETIEDHNVIYYDLLHVEDGKVTKAFQFTATDKERTKFLEDLANAKDKVETTTAAKASNSNEKSSNANSSNSNNSNASDSKGNSKGSESKDIFDQIDNFFDQLDTDKIGEGLGKGIFYIVLIIAVFFGIKGRIRITGNAVAHCLPLPLCDNQSRWQLFRFAYFEGLILVTHLGHFLLEHLVFPRLIEVTFCRILKLLSRAALRSFG